MKLLHGTVVKGLMKLYERYEKQFFRTRIKFKLNSNSKILAKLLWFSRWSGLRTKKLDHCGVNTSWSTYIVKLGVWESRYSTGVTSLTNNKQLQPTWGLDRLRYYRWFGSENFLCMDCVSCYDMYAGKYVLGTWDFQPDKLKIILQN